MEKSILLLYSASRTNKTCLLSPECQWTSGIISTCSHDEWYKLSCYLNTPGSGGGVERSMNTTEPGKGLGLVRAASGAVTSGPLLTPRAESVCMQHKENSFASGIATRSQLQTTRATAC